MNRQEKGEAVESIRELLNGAQLIVLAEYSGLDVSSMVELRQAVKKSNGNFRIVKNTLAKLATAETDFEPLNPHLKGPLGMAVTNEDVAATAKALVAFKKANPKFEIKAGVMAGGELLDAAGIETLSKLPGKDELRSMLLSTMNGVATKMVRLVSAVPRDMVGVLEARRRSLAGEA